MANELFRFNSVRELYESFMPLEFPPDSDELDLTGWHLNAVITI